MQNAKLWCYKRVRLWTSPVFCITKSILIPKIFFRKALPYHKKTTTKQYLKLNYQTSGIIISLFILLFVVWDFLTSPGIGKKVQNGLTQPKLCFGLPEGVQKHVERLSLFITKSILIPKIFFRKAFPYYKKLQQNNTWSWIIKLQVSSYLYLFYFLWSETF